MEDSVAVLRLLQAAENRRIPFSFRIFRIRAWIGPAILLLIFATVQNHLSPPQAGLSGAGSQNL